jgi:hypothetical protein
MGVTRLQMYLHAPVKDPRKLFDAPRTTCFLLCSDYTNLTITGHSFHPHAQD